MRRKGSRLVALNGDSPWPGALALPNPGHQSRPGASATGSQNTAATGEPPCRCAGLPRLPQMPSQPAGRPFLPGAPSLRPQPASAAAALRSPEVTTALPMKPAPSPPISTRSKAGDSRQRSPISPGLGRLPAGRPGAALAPPAAFGDRPGAEAPAPTCCAACQHFPLPRERLGCLLPRLPLPPPLLLLLLGRLRRLRL